MAQPGADSMAGEQEQIQQILHAVDATLQQLHALLDKAIKQVDEINDLKNHMSQIHLQLQHIKHTAPQRGQQLPPLNNEPYRHEQQIAQALMEPQQKEQQARVFINAPQKHEQQVAHTLVAAPPYENQGQPFNTDGRMYKRQAAGYDSETIDHSNLREIALPNDEAQAFLVIHTENMHTQSFPLYSGNNPIGRDPVDGQKSILIAGDDYVSRHHCLIVLRGRDASIADDGRFGSKKPSLNGTYYNGSARRIVNQALKNGDTVQIGMTKMVFKWNDAEKKQIEREVEASEFMPTIVINP